MRSLLAIDQSSSVTGLAWTNDLGQSGRSSTIFRIDPKQDRAERLCGFHARCGQYIDHVKPNLVLYEKPNLGQRMSMPVARMLLGITASIEMLCHHRGIPVLDVHNSTIKAQACRPDNYKNLRNQVIQQMMNDLCITEKEATNRAPGKRVMVEQAERKGWQVRSDDEADALWLLDYAITQIENGKLKIG